MKLDEKVYLGDSVYARFDDFRIVLTTENGYGPTNKVVLEPEVIENFEMYLKALREVIVEAGGKL